MITTCFVLILMNNQSQIITFCQFTVRLFLVLFTYCVCVTSNKFVGRNSLSNLLYVEFCCWACLHYLHFCRPTVRPWRAHHLWRHLGNVSGGAVETAQGNRRFADNSISPWEERQKVFHLDQGGHSEATHHVILCSEPSGRRRVLLPRVCREWGRSQRSFGERWVRHSTQASRFLDFFVGWWSSFSYSDTYTFPHDSNTVFLFPLSLFFPPFPPRTLRRLLQFFFFFFKIVSFLPPVAFSSLGIH